MLAVRLQCCVSAHRILRSLPSFLIHRQVTNLVWVQGISSASLCYFRTQVRGAKTVSRRKVKDLEQGPIHHGTISTNGDEDGLQYPTVLQGVKNNMIKFDKCVLLTRVGNFYELYFEHAEEYGPLLGLKVSSRRTLLGGVPMAGFPYFQLERFLKILVEDLNKYVAISEEFPIATTSSAKAGGPLFERKVARVVSPGTLIDEKFLNPLQNNFLLSLHLHTVEVPNTSTCEGLEDEIGLAWLDLSTGEFFIQTASRSLLASVLMRIGAREIVLDPSAPSAFRQELGHILGNSHDLVTSYEASTKFSSMSDWNPMLESPIDTSNEILFTQAEKLAGHLLLDYVENRLQGLHCRLRQPQKRQLSQTLNIDRSSLRGLEILETSRDGFGKGSLFHAVRRTVTDSGARLLRDRLTNPSASLAEINTRLDLITVFYKNETLREALMAHLRKIYDMKRLVQKFALNKGDADDMILLAKAITETAKVAQLLKTVQMEGNEKVPPGHYHAPDVNPIHKLISRLSHSGPAELEKRIVNAIDEDNLNQKHQIEDDEATAVAVMVQEVVRNSAPEELANLPKDVRTRTKSETKTLSEDAGDLWIMRKEASSVLTRLHHDLEQLQEEKMLLQHRLRNDLSAPSLTLKWTPGLGHICHIKGTTRINDGLLENMHAKMVSSSKSTRSFYQPQWSKLGNRMDQTTVSIRGEEQRIFTELRGHVIQNLVSLRRNAAVMDELDVACSFASLAVEQNWTKPILNNGQNHKIIGGRHPTVKLGLEEKGRSFISNDLFLGDQERVWIVTGPNMAGKSTFLRQNALITILAQVGSYVPAEHAELGLVDQIFSRIGAADDLFRDQSTFMVEMLETAAILQNATSRSFVIMDEVGRGTTPEDGTAVAFASLHHLYHHNGCRTLFATHFHALHDMTRDWKHVGRYCTDLVDDESGGFSFLHKLRPGVNTQSHALKIARMAGLPDTAIVVAERVLHQKS